MTFEVYGIYDVLDPDRIRYVGLTERGFMHRLNGHWKQANYTNRKLPILLWMRKRTVDQVGIKVLETADNRSHMKLLERFWIAQYRDLGMADLNLTDGGEAGSGYVFSAERRAAMSEARTGEKGSFYGRTHSQESRESMSKAGLARFKNETKEQRIERINKAGKLKDQDVLEIKRMLWSGATLAEVASVFGVCFQNISKIKNGDTFQHVPWPTGPAYKKPQSYKIGTKHRNSKLTEDIIRDVRRRAEIGENHAAMAREYGVDPVTIHKIIHRITWKHIE